jgi:hypothetical protein
VRAQAEKEFFADLVKVAKYLARSPAQPAASDVERPIARADERGVRPGAARQRARTVPGRPRA